MAEKIKTIPGKIIVMVQNGDKANKVRGSIVTIKRTVQKVEQVSPRKEFKYSSLQTIGKINVGSKWGAKTLFDETTANAKVKELRDIMEKATGYKVDYSEAQKLLCSGEFKISDVERIVK